MDPQQGFSSTSAASRLRGLAGSAVLVNADDTSSAAVGAKSVLGAVAVTLADGALAADVHAVGAARGQGAVELVWG